MTNPETFEAWTDAEKETWKAWSRVEQDLSQPQAKHRCEHVLDALETSAHQLTRMQGLLLRSACDGARAYPLLPPPAEALIERSCASLTNWSDWQQHLISAWFGMARQVAITTSAARPRNLDR